MKRGRGRPKSLKTLMKEAGVSGLANLPDDSLSPDSMMFEQQFGLSASAEGGSSHPNSMYPNHTDQQQSAPYPMDSKMNRSDSVESQLFSPPSSSEPSSFVSNKESYHPQHSNQQSFSGESYETSKPNSLPSNITANPTLNALLSNPMFESSNPPKDLLPKQEAVEFVPAPLPESRPPIKIDMKKLQQSARPAKVSKKRSSSSTSKRKKRSSESSYHQSDEDEYSDDLLNVGELSQDSFGSSLSSMFSKSTKHSSKKHKKDKKCSKRRTRSTSKAEAEQSFVAKSVPALVIPVPTNIAKEDDHDDGEVVVKRKKKKSKDKHKSSKKEKKHKKHRHRDEPELVSMPVEDNVDKPKIPKLVLKRLVVPVKASTDDATSGNAQSSITSSSASLLSYQVTIKEDEDSFSVKNELRVENANAQVDAFLPESIENVNSLSESAPSFYLDSAFEPISPQGKPQRNSPAPKSILSLKQKRKEEMERFKLEQEKELSIQREEQKLFSQTSVEMQTTVPVETPTLTNG